VSVAPVRSQIILIMKRYRASDIRRFETSLCRKPHLALRIRSIVSGDCLEPRGLPTGLRGRCHGSSHGLHSCTNILMAFVILCVISHVIL
jgi:hypothetical protein